jgi:uncharacterized Zn finger protein
MHNNDMIRIEQEGILDRCDKCGIFQKDVGIKHQQSKQRKICANKKELQKKQIENTRSANETTFTILNNSMEFNREYKGI